MENKVLEAIKNRKSTRKYKFEQINEEELQIILDAGIQAPSAMNLQPWHFTVIQDKNLINHISDKSKEVMMKSDNEKIVNFGNSPINIFYDAPTIIVVSCKEDVTSSLVDCSAAIQNMLIASEALELGSVWIGFIKFYFTLEDEVKKLNIPDGYKPFYSVAIGYKNNEVNSGPSNRNKDCINYIR